MALDSMKEIFDRMEQEGKPFWEIVLETDMDERQVTRNQSMAKMLITWQAMADAADSYTGRRKSVSGLVGGDGMKMRQYCLRGEAMYAVVIDPLSGYDTGTPSGWMATNALMAASDPRFASAFWDAIDERGGLMRK